MAQTNMIQTFPVTIVGIPGVSSVSNNIAEFGNTFGNVTTLEGKVQQLETNIDALKQK